MNQRSVGDVAAIRNHLDILKQTPWLGAAREWWPDYLFHATAMENVVSILTTGELVSRKGLETTARLKVDIAAPDIIERTDAKSLDHVRLYFRPRTPTQFNNEGFRPKGQWEYNSHCPIPVYLLFDSETVLSRADSRFTDGNVAAGVVYKKSVDGLKGIPFEWVYHDSWFDPPDRSKIIFHRNAEVLVPQRLDLHSLRAICCRSQAEYETLTYLLPPEVRSQWASKVVVRPDWRLFHNRWTFVQQVELTHERLFFKFNRDTRTPGPFRAGVVLTNREVEPHRSYEWRTTEFVANDELVLRLTSLGHVYDYEVKFFLDEQLAFASRHMENDLPF